MPLAVILMLSDDGQMLVGEVDPAAIPQDELQPVETFEEGVSQAEQILLGEEPPPGVEEDAFQGSLATDDGGSAEED